MELGARTLVAVLLALALPAMAQENKSKDRHLASEAAGVLLAGAPFAHGYLHGYEDGFRAGDMDHHLARAQRDLRKDDQYRAAKASFRPSGHRAIEEFRNGYRQGYAAAYADSYYGRDYRGLGLVRQAATEMNGSPGKGFDAGFANGYLSGLTHGRFDGARDNDFDQPNPGCATSDSSVQPDAYCDGFTRGFAMGYSDGYLAGLDQPDSIELMPHRGAPTQTTAETGPPPK